MLSRHPHLGVCSPGLARQRGLKKLHLYRGDRLSIFVWNKDVYGKAFCCIRHTPPSLRDTSPNLGEELLTR